LLAAACLSFNPPMSNTNGVGVVGFWVVGYAFMTCWIVVSGAIAEFAVNIRRSTSKKIQ